MSITTAPPALRKTRGPSVTPDQPPTVERNRMRPFGDRRLFGPGWPLKILFIGFPLWWVVGLSEPMCFVAGALMALELLHRRRLAFPRGFVVWAMFLAFVVGGVFLLQVDVFGAVPGGANTRYVTWAYRLAWYLTATTLMLYIGNLRRELSLRDVTRTISWMFVTLTVGGLLAVLVPTFTFQSLMELVLPHRVDSIAFVRDLIHPSVAQLYTADGALNPRPSAPFPYANDWGVNYACLLPFFIATWFGKGAGWRRYVGPFIFVASLVPVIESQNRGLWLALVAMAAFLVVYSVMAGHLRLLVSVLGASAALTVLVLVTPLSGVIEGKLSNDQQSTSTRSNLGEATFEGVRHTSPLVGVGTTRNVQGNFDSIAGGASATCPLCSPPSLGTQGQLWLVMFCQGFVGLALYLGFLLYQFFRHLRLHSPYVTVGLCALIAHFATMPFYNAIGPAILFVMAGVALMWRESSTPAMQRAEHPLAAAAARLAVSDAERRRPFWHRSSTILVVWACLGGFVGLAWQHEAGTTYVAKVSIWLQADPAYPDASRRPETLDTAAQVASGQKVLSSISEATEQTPRQVARSLSVTAVPNTRVLQLFIRADSPATAKLAAFVAAPRVLEIREDDLTHKRNALVSQLRAKTERLAITTRAINRAVNESGGGQHNLTKKQYELGLETEEAQANLALVESLPVDAGEIVRRTNVRPVHDGWYIAFVTGLLIGLTLGAVHLRSRDYRPTQVRSRLRLRLAPAKAQGP